MSERCKIYKGFHKVWMNSPVPVKATPVKMSIMSETKKSDCLKLEKDGFGRTICFNESGLVKENACESIYKSVDVSGKKYLIQVQGCSSMLQLFDVTDDNKKIILKLSIVDNTIKGQYKDKEELKILSKIFKQMNIDSSEISIQISTCCYVFPLTNWILIYGCYEDIDKVN